ncbi:MAG: hypothetical protein ACTSRR_09850 [Candidatus Heimdallarchaeaceae archaeon]
MNTNKEYICPNCLEKVKRLNYQPILGHVCEKCIEKYNKANKIKHWLLFQPLNYKIYIGRYTKKGFEGVLPIEILKMCAWFSDDLQVQDEDGCYLELRYFLGLVEQQYYEEGCL